MISETKREYKKYFELIHKEECKLRYQLCTDGKKYSTNHYNLDAIIAVGYRVNSKKATAFRIWANSSGGDLQTS